VAAFDESGKAADGEEITNKIPRIEEGLKQARSGHGHKSSSPSDVPDSRGLQAFSQAQSQRISKIPQGLVNHVSQALVNHADECRAGDVRLTSLFKPIPTRLWQGLSYRPGT
jgi:hypothetical protein